MSALPRCETPDPLFYRGFAYGIAAAVLIWGAAAALVLLLM